MKKNIEIIGKFYDNHSLAIINREVAIRLGDEEVFPNINLTITPVDQFNSVYKIKKDHIKKLKELFKFATLILQYGVGLSLIKLKLFISNLGNTPRFLLSGNINLNSLQII